MTLKEESRLNAKGYSERDEKRILDALGRGLLKEFPNPERAGCPGSDVLKSIASHEMPLPEAEKWLDHLTSCSPCYADFSQLRTAAERRRTQTLLAIAASILIVVCLAGWAFFLRQKEPLVAQTAVLDLSNRSIPRGSEPNPSEPPLEVNRTVSRLTIFLPLGSSEGDYEVRILTNAGESLMRGSGAAKLSDHITSLQISVNLAASAPGQYTLQVRRNGQEWNSYQLLLH